MTCIKRPYTGNKDGRGHRRAGTEAFVRAIAKASGFRFYNLGTFVVRPMRGKTAMSVHATGRAFDVGRAKTGKHKGASRAYMLLLIDWLVDNAAAMGVEMVADYQYRGPLPNGKPAAGRVWKCDRCAWKAAAPGVLWGGGTATWLHVELDPVHADSTDWIADAMKSFPAPPEKIVDGDQKAG